MTTSETIEFFVPGIPRPQGSKRAVPTRNGKIALIESSPHLKDWRALISVVAHNTKINLACDSMAWDAVEIDLIFLFPRPKSHLNSKGELRDSSPAFPTNSDVDKLTRGAFDALTGILIRDDSLIASVRAVKLFTREDPGAHFFVRRISTIAEWAKEFLASKRPGILDPETKNSHQKNLDGI